MRKSVRTALAYSTVAAAVLAQVNVAAADFAAATSTALTLPRPTTTPTTTCSPVTATTPTQTVTLTQTFLDDFHQGLRLSTAAKSSVWTPHFDGGYNATTNIDPGYGWPAYTKRTLPGNQEQEVYVDPGFKGTGTKALGLNPFSYDSTTNTVSITATKADAVNAPFLKIGSAGTTLPGYFSGLLTTRASFSQKYGYFEVNANLPAGNHLWDGFWLLGTNNKAWPPEIDVVEMKGQDTAEFPSTVWYTAANGTAAHSGCYTKFPAPVTGTFHAYGVLWTQDRITFYFDRQPYLDLATPATLNTYPMYFLINLGVGGTYSGAADSTTPMPSVLKIKWATAYSVK